MAIRFRKRVTLAPGLRMNFSFSGISWSAGPQGASLTVGKRGTYFNAGIPGTGLYSRERVGTATRSGDTRGNAGGNKVTVSANVKVEDDGTIAFTDDAGTPLSDYMVEQAKKQNRDTILDLIKSACDRINAKIDSVGQVHLGTPSPDQKPGSLPAPFDLPQPTQPVPKKAEFLANLFRSKREAIDQQNAEAQLAYEAKLADWERAKAEHVAALAARRKLIEEDIFVDPTAMEQHLGESLAAIEWPRETEVSFDIVDGGATVLLDVDLPEVEHMPTKTAAVPQRGLKLTVKDLPATKVRRLYMDHVHGVVFRIVGAVFAALPTVQTVVASGYSQRPDKSTGQIVDQYLLSVRVPRETWRTIDFSNLDAVDVSDALSKFDLVRDVTKTGIFTAIEPIAA